MTHPHRWAGASLLLVLAFVAAWKLPPAIDAWARAPGDLTAVARTLPPLLDRHAAEITARADRRIADAVRRADVRIERATAAADARLEQALEVVNRRSGEALEVAAGARADLKPTLENAAALAKDARESWNDLYWDVKAGIESGTVAARGIAEASEAIGKAAPGVTASVAGISASADGIAADAWAWTDRNVRPRPKGFWGWVATVARTAFGVFVVASRGGVI
jgi:hypothetical protein